MNTEEKAKAYDEALEKARKRVTAEPQDHTDEILKDIFPELRESEDERIRKWLIEMVEVFRKANPTNAEHNGDCSEAIAYLEKQKEPVPIPDKFSGLKSIMLQYLQSAANHKDDVEIEDDTDLFGRKILDYVWKYDEKQKEHQNNNSSAPNESSWTGNISSSHKDKNLDEISQDYVDGVKEYNPEPTWDLMQTAVCYGYHYCEQKEQKPAMSRDKILHQLFQNGSITLSDYLYLTGEQKPEEKQDYSGLTELERAIHRGFLCAGVENVPVTIIKETAQECLSQMNPAEWDDYTKTNLDRALQIIKDAKGKLQGYQSDDGIYECDKAIECLEHFLYRGLEIEKPAEWNEEDSVGLDEAFACVTNAEKTAKNEEELQNAVTAEKWLKEIKSKYYVHPVKQEWSEEDDVMLDKVCCLISPGTKLTDDNADYCVELKQWIFSLRKRILKSLYPQPNWKPSKEQMKALYCAIQTYRFQHNVKDKRLNSLYNDLQKLM